MKKFYITDVFAKQAYTGNQLATLTGCNHLSTEEMQQIAAEINFSETTFILSDKEVKGGYDVRIFTPKSELDFAGHPTLGTAYMINKLYLNNQAESLTLNLKVGKIPVDFKENLLWMKQIQPRFGKEMDPQLLAKTLSIPVSEIDERFPVMKVSTGLPVTIVPLKSLNALKKAKINLNHYEDFLSQTDAKPIMIFAPQGQEPEQSMSTRCFVNFLGIPEDPATGSAAGCLAGYLLENNYFNSTRVDIKIGQGYEMQRPSELHIKAINTNRGIDIRVGGQVFPIAEGIWL